MREIKFRVFDGEKVRPITSYEWEESMVSDKHNLESILDDSEYKALMQFTGLKDKNGKEIYEGDIISFISFDKEYILECPNLSYFHFWQETKDNKTVEVIGNIYETPELLK